MATAAEARKRFSVIINEKMELDEYKRISNTCYQTDPLREQLVRFRNDEGGRRFTVEDLLRW